MNNLMTAVLTTIIISLITLSTIGIATAQDTPELHMVACYMPNGTQEYHMFDYDTAPAYDLCTEVGGTAY